MAMICVWADYHDIKLTRIKGEAMQAVHSIYFFPAQQTTSFLKQTEAKHPNHLRIVREDNCENTIHFILHYSRKNNRR